MNDFRRQNGRFKLTLPIREIPEFSYVTKPTGLKEYELKRKLPVYFEKGEHEGFAITMPDGCFYLCSEDGVEVVNGDKPMAVHFDTYIELSEFIDLLKEMESC